ncbi:MAG: hypothetical protein NVS3B2_07550 [Ramlibacter sp.]
MTVTGLSPTAGKLCVMRQFLALVALLAGSAHAATIIPCDGRPTGYGSAEVMCAVEPGLAAGLLRFNARFSGVHDDSQAGMAVSLDDSPVLCSGDSMTRIAGENSGDTLVCRFKLAAAPGATRRIRVNLLWFHAEPAAFDLVRESPSGRGAADQDRPAGPGRPQTPTAPAH